MLHESFTFLNDTFNLRCLKHDFINIMLPTLRRRIFIIFSLYFVTIAMLHFYEKVLLKYQILFSKSVKAPTNPGSCEIPKLNPFHLSIKHLIKRPSRTKCRSQYYLLFNSTLNSTIVPIESEIARAGIESCSYKIVSRLRGSQKAERLTLFSEQMYPVSLVYATKVPSDHEFIAIYCKDKKNKGGKLVEVHAFVHIKPKVEDRLRQLKNDSWDGNQRPNVVIFGLDALSQMNFIRAFPRTHKFLVNNLSSLQMAGYNKVGENTFPNIVPLLTSLPASVVDSTCGKSNFYDKCPFIWKDFSRKGYRTGFAEDATSISIFNYGRKGFRTPPTDYYLRPFSLAADTHTGHHRRLYTTLCQGPRLGFENLLDYLKKFVFTMERINDHPYFYFSWTTSLTHDDINDGLLGDKQFFEALEWLQKSKYLENTVLIVMSDHGSRLGIIREYSQGKIEDRLPLMHLVFPKWFQEKYEKFYSNLKVNRNRLVTTFDLHKTLKDLLNLGESRETEIKVPIQRRKQETQKGTSLFNRISENRTCNEANIPDIFCICTFMKQVPIDTGYVLEGASVAVAFINKILKSTPACSKLSLARVLTARKFTEFSSSVIQEESFLINFITTPGRAAFEANLKKRVLKNNLVDKIYWAVSDTLVRTNSYDSMSNCVNDTYIKKFCHCLLR